MIPPRQCALRTTARALAAGIAALVAFASAAPAQPAAPARVASPPIQSVERAYATLAALDSDGSRDAVLFGLPTASQSTRVAAAASDVLAALDQADKQTDAAVAELESRLIGASALTPAESAEIERSLARLVDVEQAQRIPLARGVAHALLAGASEGDARAAAVQSAVTTLAPLRLPGAGPDAERSLALAAAMLRTPNADPALIAAALREIETVLQSAAAKDDPAIRRRAALALLAAEPARSPGQADLPPLALAESRARGHIDAAKRTPSQRAARTGAACRVLLEVLSSDPAPSPERRVLVYAKVSACLDGSVPLADLPPEATLARAITAARSIPNSAEAALLLKQLLARADLTPALRAEALWESAILAQSSPEAAERTRSLSLLAQFAAEFPDDSRALSAARAAAFAPIADRPTLRRLLGYIESSPAAPAADRDRARAAILQFHATDPDPTPPNAELITSLIRRASEISDPAHRASASAALVSIATSTTAEPVWSSLPPPQRLAIARSLAPWAANNSAPEPLQLRLHLLLGEELARAQDQQAIPELSALIGSALDEPGRAERARFRLPLAIAQRRAGDAPAALTTLRVLTDEFDAPPPNLPAARTPPPSYWSAWAEALEILNAQDTDRARAPELRAQIKRLELIDPALGNAEPAARIRALRAAMEQEK